jgi:hypothetical protein
MKLIPLIFVSLLVFSRVSFAQETSHYDVVNEFIRELGDTKSSRDAAMAEIAQTDKLGAAEKQQQSMIDAIRNCTRISLKLKASNSMLKNMTLVEPFDTLIPTIIAWNEQKLKLYGEISEISKVFMGGAKSGVDYATPAARMPEITAEMEYADESIFNLTPMVFATLISDKPDSKGHLSHLIITKAEKKNLVSRIDSYFGSSLSERNQNWTVSSAVVLRTYLAEKGYKYSDDVWE